MLKTGSKYFLKLIKECSAFCWFFMRSANILRKYDDLCVDDDIREAFKVFDMVRYHFGKVWIGSCC